MQFHTLQDEPLPLVIEPGANRNADGLVEYLEQNRADVTDKLHAHGALLMRGFRISAPEDFEAVARTVEPGLKNVYIGTSPRDVLTDYVYSASELPSFYPIPQHCELSFAKEPANKLFFCCFVPSETGGETPLVDFRKVHDDMNPDIRDEFEERGISIVRNHPSRRSGGRRLDMWRMKSWEDTYDTEDRGIAEQKCRDQDYEVEWFGDCLQVRSRQEAFREQPGTGRKVWHNHLCTFHYRSFVEEYERIWKARPTPRAFLVLNALRVMTKLTGSLRRPDDHGVNCTFGDGGEIPSHYFSHLVDLIWGNMIRFPWQVGDVLAIDNYAVSHGRMPYTGPRKVAVCWS